MKEKVILLDANATAEDNNSEGAIRTSDGTYLPAQEGVVPSALQGRRGVLVLDDKDRIVTFLPDETASVTVTLSGAAQPTYLTGTNGTRYNIDGDTPAYTSSKENPVTTYEKLYLELRSGSQVTLYTADGKVVGLYYGSSGASTDAVVVSGTATEAMFHQLTGGASNYTIEKNGQTITMADIQPYDVVTYDSVANKLIVSDLRLPCVYESAEPNPRAPQKITVLGHEFTVLESALESIQSFDVGKTVVLLLDCGRQRGRHGGARRPRPVPPPSAWPKAAPSRSSSPRGHHRAEELLQPLRQREGPAGHGLLLQGGGHQRQPHV